MLPYYTFCEVNQNESLLAVTEMYAMCEVRRHWPTNKDNLTAVYRFANTTPSFVCKSGITQMVNIMYLCVNYLYLALYTSIINYIHSVESCTAVFN